MRQVTGVIEVRTRGKGLYEVSYAFGMMDMGAAMERTFWLNVDFTDTLGCAVDGGTADEVEYYFGVMAVH